ncbi:MAG: hypothetical protein NC041_01610 [Bacteroides sp.]|nr:hypothetical protein [Prevotella sp.]MCM1407700.1 hypothetical protein [Treponema brennaborense]MCM1469150.1 hypothetical protein [Bacteroides sp.]
MDSKETWNKICELFERHKSSPEAEIQKLWENIFSEYFGYSKLGGEVSAQEKLHIGSTDRTIPDLIMKNGSEKLFAAELKRGNLPANENFKQQLISYLKLLDLNIGILICDAIFIVNISDSTETKISFSRGNPDGAKFVELFGREYFGEEKIKEFIAQKKRSAQNIENLREEIGNAKERIIELLENELAPKYGKAEFVEVMKEFEIQIIKKNAAAPALFMPKVQGTAARPYSFAGGGRNTISKSDALMLCRRNGFANGGEVTFSSTNAGNGVFWANPNVKLLSYNWWLLLNDINERKIYVLFIPKDSVNAYELRVRNDKQELLDLQIKNDGSFIDSRSKYSFKKYFKAAVKY